MTRAVLIAALVMIGSITAPTSAQPTYPHECSQRPAGWRGPKSRFGDLAMWNAMGLHTNGRLAWNGHNVSDAEVSKLLRQTYRLNPRPLVLLTIDPATPCSRVKEVRGLMNNAAICKQGHCGEGSNWPFPKPVK